MTSPTYCTATSAFSGYGRTPMVIQTSFFMQGASLYHAGTIQFCIFLAIVIALLLVSLDGWRK